MQRAKWGKGKGISVMLGGHKRDVGEGISVMSGGGISVMSGRASA